MNSQPNMRVNNDVVALAPILKCKCGSTFWEAVYILKHLNILVSPTGREELVPLPGWRCADCKKVLGSKEKKEEKKDEQEER